MKKIYFDETNNHRKIGVKINGKLRFNDKTEFFFMYAFIEISDEKLKKISNLEKKFKEEKKIPNEKELKSRHLTPQILSEMNYDQINFLTKVFNILEDDKKIMSIGCVTKLDPFFIYFMKAKFIQRILSSENIFKNEKLFIYSFQKYLSIRQLYEMNALLSSTISMKKIYSRIIYWLKNDIPKTNNKNEKTIFKKLIMIIKEFMKKDKRIWKIDKLKWNYEQTAWTLANILDERKEVSVELIYDSFKELDEVWSKKQNIKSKEFNFKSTPSHSVSNLGLRIVDWTIGFMRKITINLLKESIENRKVFNTRILVSKEVLNFMNSNIKLFTSLRKTINNDYWSTFTNTYSDNLLILIKALDIIERERHIFEEDLGRVYIQEINHMIYEN